MKNITLPTRDAAWLADTFAHNRARFGGFRMELDPKGMPPADPKVDDPDPDDGKGGKGAVLADLAKERKARQALEDQVKELAPLKDQMAAMAEAFGVKQDPKNPAADVLATVQEQLAVMRHESAVLRAANQHNITDEDDLALLESTKDPEAMGKLAVRLAAKTGDDGKPPTPKPDLTQGGKDDPPKPESLPGVPRMAQAFEDELATK